MSGKTKKILSFDVGIINLAYCLMEIDYDTNRFTIHDWDIINTADNRHRCPFVMRGGNICGKVAQKMTKVNEHNTHYACNAHWNKSTHMVQPVDINWYIDKDDALGQNMCCMCTTAKPGLFKSNIIAGCYCATHHKTISRRSGYFCAHKKCNEFITYGIYIKNIDEMVITHVLKIGWCDAHYKSEYTRYIKGKTRKISQNANKIPLELIGTSMYATLDSKKDFLQVDEVLIENQPSLINPTMKSVAMILYSYFLLNSIHRRSETKSIVTNLSYCSPSNKLKVGGQKVANTIENARNVSSKGDKNNKKVYDITKDTGKQICLALISESPKYLDMFRSHKKKDDLADAFLQGFVMNFDEVPSHYADILKKANITDSATTKKYADRKITKNAKIVKTSDNDNAIATNIESADDDENIDDGNDVDNKCNDEHKDRKAPKAHKAHKAPKLSSLKKIKNDTMCEIYLDTCADIDMVIDKHVITFGKD